ncbi:MAG: hypothetical protein HKN85_08145 [Gammaproteobacteria bacterium]|nr:hypothetical protein [Gammaproteobacteria bacterium]
MNPALLYLLISVALIGTELWIMQFSVFWFMFFGLGALVAALVSWAMPELSMVATTGVFLLASVVISIGLYPVLRKWQRQPSPIAGNDAIGQSAEVTETIAADKPGRVIWSGAEWPAQIADGEATLDVGTTVVIRKIAGIRLIVGR